MNKRQAYPTRFDGQTMGTVETVAQRHRRRQDAKVPQR